MVQSRHTVVEQKVGDLHSHSFTPVLKDKHETPMNRTVRYTVQDTVAHMRKVLVQLYTHTHNQMRIPDDNQTNTHPQKSQET